MSELIKREDAINAVEMFFKDAYIEDADVHCTDMVYEIDHIPTASPWRMVEEMPEPHKKVLVSGMEAINNSRVYKVMVNDNGEWRPKDYAPSILWDYWMPIEPPKEDA